MKRELDALVAAIDNAVGKAPTSLVLSILTGSFVGLVAALTEQAGHDPAEQIRVDGGESRDITIHADKRRGAGPSEASFQQRVQPWLLTCFGAEIAADPVDRNHRFLEEALELVQSCGCTQSEAHQLVAYVFGRPEGELAQEVGGVQLTLAALCLAKGVDMSQAGEAELARVWTKVPEIRAKQAAKPKHSPLPGPSFIADSDC